MYFLSLILLLSSVAVFTHGRTMCFEQKSEIDGNLDISANYKVVQDAKNLPASFGKLNLEGSRVWYIEGSGTGNLITIAADQKLYTNKAKIVEVFIRYYSKSPRSPSIFPVKGRAGFVTFPPSGVRWSEVKYEVDPAGPLVEISFYLSAGQFIIFDAIVIAVDNALPNNPETVCNPAESPSGSTTTSGKVTNPTTSPTAEGRPTSSHSVPGILTTITAPVKAPAGECTVMPPTECKCNCLCNCNKC